MPKDVCIGSAQGRVWTMDRRIQLLKALQVPIFIGDISHTQQVIGR